MVKDGPEPQEEADGLGGLMFALWLSNPKPQRVQIGDRYPTFPLPLVCLGVLCRQQILVSKLWRGNRMLGRSRGHPPETGSLHPNIYLRIAHESLPDELAANVLGHQHADANINSDHIAAYPSG